MAPVEPQQDRLSLRLCEGIADVAIRSAHVMQADDCDVRAPKDTVLYLEPRESLPACWLSSSAGFGREAEFGSMPP